MTKHLFTFLLTLLTAGSCLAADSATAQWPIELPQEAALARLDLGAEVLIRLRDARGSDLALSDALGRPVPMARMPDTGEPIPGETTALKPLPIHGSSETDQQAESTISLHIEQGPEGRTVRVDSLPAGSDLTESPVIGMLFDTRGLEDRQALLQLQADWPADRTVQFTADTSTDLQHWQPLGSVTVFRHEDFSTPAQLQLRGASLKDRFLRVRWHPRGDAVSISGASLTAVSPDTRPALLPLALRLPPSEDNTASEFELPFAVPPAGFDIRSTEQGRLLPVAVQARQDPEHAWVSLKRLTIFTLAQEDGGLRRNQPVLLDGRSWRQWRLEWPTAGASSALPVQTEVLLQPLQLVILTTQPGPYTLKVLPEPDEESFVPLAELLEATGTPAGLRLAEAVLPASGGAPLTVYARPLRQGPPKRQIVLWLILIAGVILLGGMAWRLLQHSATESEKTSG